MKFAFYAALIAVASAGACNDSLQAKFWGDKECTKLNDKLTGKHGKVPKEMLQFMDGNCHKTSKESSMKITCGPKAMKMQGWKNDSCNGAAARADSVPFDTCLPGGPQGTYVTIHHK